MVSSTLGHTHTQPAAVPLSAGMNRWISSGYRGDSVCVGESSLVYEGALVTYTGLGPRGPIQCMCVPELARRVTSRGKGIRSGEEI